jgi:acyl-CoA reductase-like NAD-dependent aldehyde dehydrogenase
MQDRLSDQRKDAMASALSTEQWKSRASEITIPQRALIDGDLVDSVDHVTYECVTPLSGVVLGRVVECNAPDVDKAVVAARRAFDASWWAHRPAERKRVLLELADLVRREAFDLALLITLDMGKPITEALGEVKGAAACLQFYAEAIDKTFGEVASTDDNAFAFVTREPVGVVAAIVPWNYPLMMSAWKIAPALAAGNSLILKPAEQSSLAPLRLGELAAEAGVPSGVINIVPGFGGSAGAALALHMDVDKVTFTGSAEIGKKILCYAGESNMKIVSLECGGKSPNVVYADAPNLERAAKAIANGIFSNQGEMCNAGSRLLVQADVSDELTERVIAQASEWMPGDPLDPVTTMGAVVDGTQLGRILSYIDIGKAEGARLRSGGNQVLQDTGGYYVEPTIFDRATNDMQISREEIFGPVLAVSTFGKHDDPIAMANDSDFGLAAAVWTRDISKAHRVARALRAGSVYVNCYSMGSIALPHGGFKQSGVGRDKSLHALDKYLQLKSTWVNLEDE